MSLVRIVEVGPRDGLQNEPRSIPPQDRIALVEKLATAGLTTIEVGSFVSPRWVPQMSGTAEVLRGVDHVEGVSFPVLVPNMRGLDDAIAAGAAEIAIFVAASESFSRKNVNCSIDQSLEIGTAICDLARGHGIRVRAYISCVLGCPYEGKIPPSTVSSVAARLIAIGCYEVSLGDTIGVGTPAAARHLVQTVSTVVPIGQLAIHFHDTYGQALANVLSCLETGVSVVDSAAGGLGGCPYAKGASGNLATEDLLYMLNGLGISTGVDLDKLLSAVAFIDERLGIAPRSKLYAARRLSRSGAEK